MQSTQIRRLYLEVNNEGMKRELINARKSKNCNDKKKFLALNFLIYT